MKSNKKEIIQKQEILQAVILADEFTKNLVPMNEYYPIILTPIANTPLLDYLIETLISSKVQEIYLYCTSYVEDIKKRVNILNKTKKVNINLMINEGCYSMGDAMRDIDSKGNIRGDFILLRGDVVINANLQTFVKTHRMKVNKDKGAIMTVLMQNVGSMVNSSLKDDMYCIASNVETRRMLYYDKMDGKKIVISCKALIESGETEYNADMIDTHVYICSPAVLSLFSDNFDFQTMDDFIKGIIINEEILDSRIYWDNLNFKSWGLPIISWKAYNTVTRDILQRKFYPLVPETMTCCKEYKISVTKCFYKHNLAQIDSSSSLLNFTIIGENSSVGKNSTISGAVIGKNCVIGNNVTIENSFIISDVKIGDNVSIKDSVVFFNCSIPSNVTVDSSIIAANTTIDTKVMNFGSISFMDCMVKCEEDSLKTYSLKEPIHFDPNESNAEFIHFFKDFGRGDKEEDEISESSSNETEENQQVIEDEEENCDNQTFCCEVSDSLLRGYQEKLNTENLILEINSSRYAYNVKINDVTRIVTKCILKLPIAYMKEERIEVTAQEYMKLLKGVLVYFDNILRKYIKSKVSQFQVLKAFEEVASSLNLFLPVFKYVLHYFYEQDLLFENTILEWFDKYEENDRDDDDDDGDEDDKDDDHQHYKDLNMDIKKAAQTFIDWLKEADEDDSDEESDDSEDD